jgi:hypothetical protein
MQELPVGCVAASTQATRGKRALLRPSDRLPLVRTALMTTGFVHLMHDPRSGGGMPEVPGFVTLRT